ncbi:nuclear transport factor 2 family protein [Luteimonas sp. 3794]|uniref:nuclear transport factor 2 family protein n=1 Tax=Luteimonas sp. 3794 TaxID=2817730 RepID=UPI0028601455|nr:nuclear transport factor 2 family protein [Luteimonas sp. 3794]MDR6990722.1 ketosteroid isomerase-like protein [Luteimonas sp. 3794]
MSNQHKSALRQANAAISRGDIEGFLAYCTDDIQWTTVGVSTLDGKDAVRAWMADAYAQPPVFTVDHLIAEEDFVIALGGITATAADGSQTRHAYSDVWRFHDGKMAELRAFVI